MPRKAKRESLADANAAPGGVAAVDRALSLLATFQEGDRALSVTQMAERTGLYKSTALRLLSSLAHAGMLQRTEDGRWALGAEVARLASLYAASFSLADVVMPVLRDLVQQTGESAAYHVLQRRGDDWVRLCLYRVDSPKVLRDHVRAGDLLPLERGAGARVLQAFSQQAQASTQSRDDKLYSKIREQGFYAAASDRTPELAGISAPVFLRSGKLAGALTLTMPTIRYDEAHISAVREAASALSHRVG